MKKYFLFLFLAIGIETADALVVKEGKIILEKVDDYSECQGKSYDGNACDFALKDWVERHPADSFIAGKMTRKIRNAWAAIYYFAKAFDLKAADCEDKDVWLAIKSAAALPIRLNEPLAGMKKIAFEKCYEALKEELISSANEGGYSKSNLCPSLKLKNSAPKSCSEE